MKTSLHSALTSAAYGGAAAPAADDAVTSVSALDTALESLKTFDWGTGITIPEPGKPPEDAQVLAPIDDAVVAAQGDAAALRALESRLAAVLGTGASRAAKDYVLRKLRIIGTAESVPAIAPLLFDQDLSHMARYALERNSAAEAAAALREALPKLPGPLKAALVGSLGKRRDAGSTESLVPLLADADADVAAAAVAALGMIGTTAAAQALTRCVQDGPATTKAAAADACLACAEHLLADGQKAEAVAIYKSLLAADPPQHVRLAVTRGMLVAAGKSD
jgi:tetratricopeptide (TPR) repeat protein